VETGGIILHTELRICTCNFLARVGTTIVEEEADASTSSHYTMRNYSVCSWMSDFISFPVRVPTTISQEFTRIPTTTLAASNMGFIIYIQLFRRIIPSAHG
jgi:hypothetical protein